jgi:hypothetical protein
MLHLLLQDLGATRPHPFSNLSYEGSLDSFSVSTCPRQRSPVFLRCRLFAMPLSLATRRSLARRVRFGGAFAEEIGRLLRSLDILLSDGYSAETGESIRPFSLPYVLAGSPV